MGNLLIWGRCYRVMGLVCYRVMEYGCYSVMRILVMVVKLDRDDELKL